MTTVVLVVAAATVLAAPVPSHAGLRLRALRSEVGRGGPALARGRAILHTRPVAAAALTAGSAAVLAATGVMASGVTRAVLLPGLAAASAGAVAAWLFSTATAARRDSRLFTSVVSVVAAVAAELRAGQSEAAALRSAATRAELELATVLQGAGGKAAGGGDVAGTLHEMSERSGLPPAVRSGLHRMAAAWATSRDCGTPIASVLDRVDADLRAHRRRSQQIAAQLAGPRMTAMLLSVLPALGAILGTAIGADPVRVLLATQPGQLALLAGTGLDAAGVWWTVRIVRAAGRSP